jgi:hypothetical protein
VALEAFYPRCARIRAAVLFRFGVVYFGLYSLATQIAGGLPHRPGRRASGAGHALADAPDHRMVRGAHLPRRHAPRPYTGNSADTAFHWVQMAWLLAVSVVIAAVWSWLESPPGRSACRVWFRAVPAARAARRRCSITGWPRSSRRSSRPGLVTLIEPVGASSLSDLLWTFVGASLPYQIATGVAELLAGRSC